MALEMAAEETWEGHYGYAVRREMEGWIVDPIPLIADLIEDLRGGTRVSRIAASFHNTVVLFLQEMAQKMAEETGLDRVILSGGVFQNGYLVERLTQALVKVGLAPVLHRRVPPNDGGISLGQVAIAKARMASA
jgi:hydrogenase maturation protein HypF